MLGKYKGFNVPGKSPGEGTEKYKEGISLEDSFCHKAVSDPTSSLSCGNCTKCLFGDFGEERQKEAFEEWYKVKGKVEYDKEEF